LGESTGSEEDNINQQTAALTDYEPVNEQRKTKEFIRLSRNELTFNRKVVFPGGSEALELKITLSDQFEEELLVP